MALLNVNGLKKVYTTRLGGAKVTALSGVSFTVEEGEFVAIMGESGSGKTTLLNILAGLDKPTSGQVFLNMRDIVSLNEKEISAFRRDHLGFVFQDFNQMCIRDRHGVIPAGGLLPGGAGERIGELLHLLVQVQPALPLFHHQDLIFQRGDARLGGLYLLDDKGVVDADNGADLGGVSPVDDVLFGQLQGAGNQNGPQLVQGCGADPILPPATQDEDVYKRQA